MTSFEELFIESRGQPIEWEGQDLIRSDKFPVSNGDTLVCSIESANNEVFLQGFCIDITGSCEIDGVLHKKGKGMRALFWSDGSAPPEIRIKVFTKQDFVWVYNVCEVPDVNHVGRHYNCLEWGRNGAAMIVEEIPNGRRYRCSDIRHGDKEDQFGDIVFTVQKEVSDHPL